MAKTVEEILRESGLTDEQIKALDAKVTTGLTQVLTTASSAQEKAELAQRAQQQQYDQQIAPALDTWANEKANLEAQSNYYKTLAEKAKEGGFLPAAEPFTPPGTASATRGTDGKFVAGASKGVPGSPEFIETVRAELGQAFSFASDTQWKYRRLFGAEMPDSPTALIKEAHEQRMSPQAWVEKKYDFAGKEKAMAEADKKKEIDAAVTAAVTAKEKEWAERGGNNPDVRRAEVSKFSQINKAVKEGTRPDPLKLTEKERDESTRRNIRAEIATVQ